MNNLMRDKYTWIFVNLVLSLALTIYLWIIDDSQALKASDISKDNAMSMLLLFVVFYVLPPVWLYKTIVWWRNCIRLEDSIFQSATSGTTSFSEQNGDRGAEERNA